MAVSLSSACWFVPVSRIVASWICTGRVLLNLWCTCLETCLGLTKISWLDFLYRDFFLNNSKGSRMFGDTSEDDSERRERSYQNHTWTLPVILPARAKFVTFSLIDDSRCAHAFSTTAPVRNITMTLFFLCGETAVLGVCGKWIALLLSLLTCPLSAGLIVPNT